MAKARSGKTRTAPSLRVITGGKGPSRTAADRTTRPRSRADQAAKGKRVQFDLETWHALNMLAADRMMSFQELADEAFRDLLQKHGRPADLKDALRRSLGNSKPERRHKRGARRAPPES
jgi:hypothetical protein